MPLPKLNQPRLRTIRRLQQKSQAAFWGNLGAAQCAGSRYEDGAKMPEPLAILLTLYLAGRITDADLQAARVAVSHLE